MVDVCIVGVSCVWSGVVCVTYICNGSIRIVVWFGIFKNIRLTILLPQSILLPNVFSAAYWHILFLGNSLTS